MPWAVSALCQQVRVCEKNTLTCKCLMYSYYLPNLMMPFTCGNVFLETQRGVNNHN